MDKPTERIIWPDMCKGITIFLVIVGHAIGYTVSYMGNSGKEVDILFGIYKWIYSFHMPLFFFVSGFLQKVSESRKKTTRYVVANKIIGYVVPYVFFSIAFWAIKVFFSRDIMNPVTVKDLLLIGVYPFSDFWFLYCLFMFYIIHVLLLKIGFDDRLWVVVALTISIIAMYINWKGNIVGTAIPRMCKNMTYYFSGLAIQSMISKNDCHLRVPKAIACIILGGILCYTSIANRLLSVVLIIVSAYLTIYGLLLLTQKWEIKPIGFLGKKSMYIYLVHDYAVCGVVILLSRFVWSPSITVILATFGSIVFSLIAIWLCSKSKVLDFFFRPRILFDSRD